MTEIIEIYCDESGLTGRNLLDDRQRLFTYSAVRVSDAEAWELLAQLRTEHMVLDDELKAKDLLKSERGKAFILDLLVALEGRYSIVAYDKVLALCAKLVEYVYEPVFRNNLHLLYRNNLHHFIAMYCYTFFTARDDLGGDAMRQFLMFMRSYDPAVAPLLFSPQAAEDKFAGNPFDMVAAFANGYRDIIIPDNQSERDAATSPGTLTLDLTSAALFSLLCEAGEFGKRLAVTCDSNPQLATVTPSFTGGDDDPSIRRVRDLFPDSGPVGYQLARPIAFADSRNHPGLQVADLIAGAGGACGLGSVEKRGLQRHLEALNRHIHPHAIFPDFSIVQPNQREALVNWTVLFGLGERAKKGQDPLHRLSDIYKEAERAWDRGELKPLF